MPEEPFATSCGTVVQDRCQLQSKYIVHTLTPRLTLWLSDQPQPLETVSSHHSLLLSLYSLKLICRLAEQSSAHCPGARADVSPVLQSIVSTKLGQLDTMYVHLWCFTSSTWSAAGAGG